MEETLQKTTAKMISKLYLEIDGLKSTIGEHHEEIYRLKNVIQQLVYTD